jgi:hypothetical protein
MKSGGSCKEEMNRKSLLLCEYLLILIYIYFLMFCGGIHQSSHKYRAVSLGVSLGLL